MDDVEVGKECLLPRRGAVKHKLDVKLALVIVEPFETRRDFADVAVNCRLAISSAPFCPMLRREAWKIDLAACASEYKSVQATPTTSNHRQRHLSPAL
jgi:hypothetical protein